MVLNSIFFLPFITFVTVVMVLLQHICKNKAKKCASAQKICLLLCSYVFIGLTNYMYFVIVLCTTVLVYLVGLRIGKTKEKGPLVLGISFLVADLCYFKYTNFFIGTIAKWCHKDFMLLNILLPLGISFYVFTSIGYLVDVYKGIYEPEHNFVNLALMISLFSKAISGPIVRGENFLPQVKQYRGISFDYVMAGTQMFFLGLFKKIVLADHLSVFVNDVFFVPTAFDTSSVWLAIISYSLQIYFDFAGYSDMAIGATKILGIDIEPNFNLPYIAKSPSEFWERWHISLSSWLKNYLYIPLGGSQKGTMRTYANLLIVMVISGIWHGAGWTFIVWGALHGIYSCVYKLSDTISGKRLSGTHNVLFNLLSVLLNFIVVTILWVFFRAESLENALAVLKVCFTPHTGIHQPFAWSWFSIAILLLATAISITRCRKKCDAKIDGMTLHLDLSKMSNQIPFFTFVGVTIIMGYFGNTAFIYGAF